MESGSPRREQILHEALHLFAAQGIHSTGLRDVAKKVGITQPSLYHYFASKEDLIRAIIDGCSLKAAQMQDRQSAKVMEAPTLRQGLLFMGDQLLRSFEEPDHQALQRMMMGELTRGGPLGELFAELFVRPRRERASRLFVDLMKAGKIRDMDPDLLAIQFMGPIMFAGILRMNEKGLTVERFRELVFQHLETFIRGIERNA